MSELTELLRTAAATHTQHFGILREAADRIEALEAALRGALSYIEAQLEFMAGCVSDSEMVKELRAALDKDAPPSEYRATLDEATSNPSEEESDTFKEGDNEIMLSISQLNFYQGLLSQSRQKRVVLVQKRDRLDQRIAALDKTISGYQKNLESNNIDSVLWNPVIGRYEERP